MSREGEGVCSPSLYRFALLTACATLVLIVAGSLVTSTDAGDSVPDWPLSFGQVIPWRHLVGNVLYEYGHRVIASTVGVLTITLNILLWKYESRRWVRRVGLIALLAVVAQGTLGGVRVLLLEYRFPVAIIHACLAQIFFCLIVSLTVFISRNWFEISNLKSQISHRANSSVLYLLAAATASIFLQLILGATFRHRGLGIVPHIVGAVVVTVLLVWSVIAVQKMANECRAAVEVKQQGLISSYLGQPATVAAVILLVQLVLGISAYVARLASVDDPQPLQPMISLTVAHVAGGALTLAAAVVLLLRIYRIVTPASALIDLSSRPQRALP